MNQRNDATRLPQDARRGRQRATANFKRRLTAFVAFFALSLAFVLAACGGGSSVRGLASDAAGAGGGGAGSYGGQWLVEFKTGEEKVYLTLRYDMENHHSNTTRNVAPAELVGLTREQAMSAGGTQVKFQLQRDAGAFQCEGWFKNGKGSGHYVFAPNPTYVSELSRRGYDAPSDEQQFSMALHDVSLAFVEALRAEGYEPPRSKNSLIRARTASVSTTCAA
ncbi:MAG: hypothetical protein QOD28_648 [Acidobacteriota bacterium]|nr:hypothetical protein [Acidobacteriota bacterium]